MLRVLATSAENLHEERSSGVACDEEIAAPVVSCRIGGSRYRDIATTSCDRSPIYPLAANWADVWTPIHTTWRIIMFGKKNGAQAAVADPSTQREGADDDRALIEEKIPKIKLGVLCMYMGGNGPWRSTKQRINIVVQGDDLRFEAPLAAKVSTPLVTVTATSDMSMERSKHVTATRVVALGVFSLAAKKGKTEMHQYLHVEGTATNKRQQEGAVAFVFETKNAVGIASAINKHVADARERHGLPAVSELAESIGPMSVDIPEQIKKLAELRDGGILTPEEFGAKKSELLSRM